MLKMIEKIRWTRLIKIEKKNQIILHSNEEEEEKEENDDSYIEIKKFSLKLLKKI